MSREIALSMRGGGYHCFDGVDARDAHITIHGGVGVGVGVGVGMGVGVGVGVGVGESVGVRVCVCVCVCACVCCGQARPELN